jgi:tetratricopeptide (TPR) repeat protein
MISRSWIFGLLLVSLPHVPVQADEVEDAAPALAKINAIFNGLASALERGADFQPSMAAAKGDALYSEGDLDAAAGSYRAAVGADPSDLRSRFLRACILLETGKAQEAADEFQAIARRDPKVSSAKFLHQVALRRLRLPAESMADAALAEFRAFTPKPRVDSIEWDGDPVSDLLVGQMIAGKGIHHIDAARLDAVTAKYPEDPEIAVGTARLRQQPQQQLAIEAALERFPRSPTALAAEINVLSAAEEKNLPEIIKLLERMAQSDPQNAITALLLIYYRNYEPRNLEESAKERPLPPDVVDECREAADLPKYERYPPVLSRAGLRVLGEARSPFRLLNGNYGTADIALGRLCQRLSESAKSDFAAGRVESGSRTVALLETLWKRATEAKGALIPQLLIYSALASAQKSALHHYEKTGGTEEVAAIKKQMEAGAKSRPIYRTNELPLLFLPVPSLQNDLSGRMYQDEAGFFREQARLAEDAPEKARTP